jgi:Cu-Zn family superoxide dismutase
MHITRILAIGATGALAVAAAAAATSPSAGADGGEGAMHARATIVDVTGATIGFARFTEDAAGRVHVNVKVTGLTPGLHGIHVHAVGACAPDFNAASGHHNPLAAPHGAHAGDLPNLIVNEDGQGHVNATVERFTLTDGPTTAFDADGSAIIVHALADDFVTQPTGGSGGRIACGVLTPS